MTAVRARRAKAVETKEQQITDPAILRSARFYNEKRIAYLYSEYPEAENEARRDAWLEASQALATVTAAAVLGDEFTKWMGK